MNLQQFGNAFKQAIAEKLADGTLSRKRAERIAPRYLADDPAAGLEAILTQDYVYAGGTGEINDNGGSKVIDSWWAVFRGPDNVGDIKDEKDKVIPGGGNPFSINLSGAEDEGTIELPNGINVEIDHGDINERIDLTGGVNEDWRDGNYVRIGYLLGRLFACGYEAGDICLDEDNNLAAVDQNGSAIGGGYAGLLEFDRLWRWRTDFLEVDKHTTGGGDDDFFVNNLSMVDNEDREVIYEWLIKQIELGIFPECRLIPIQCQELHRLGYQPKDLFNGDDDLVDGGTIGHVNVFDWVNGRWVEDFANIEQVHKLGEWCRAVNPDFSDPVREDNYSRPKLSFDPLNYTDDEEIMCQWLTRQRDVEINLENRLEGGQVQELHKLGWDPKDLSSNEDGDWRALDPLTGEWIVGIDNILAVGKIKKFADALSAAKPTGGDVSGGRKKLIFVLFGGSTAKEWLNTIYQKGINPRHLTVAHIQRLHQQGWDPADVVAQEGDFGEHDFTVIDPTDGEVFDLLTGFGPVDNLGRKIGLWRTAMGGPTAGFRNQELDGTGDNDDDNAIMDEWFELTKSGGGVIANNELTAARARALWDNNWDIKDILYNKDGGWAVRNPLIKNGYSEGFDEIIALGDKKEFLKAVNAKYRADFRAAAMLATNKKARDELNDNNELNNFIIDQYREGGVTPSGGVEAYHCGWIYGLEICWTNKKNERGVSPDGGKNWYKVDWSAETRDSYLQNLVDDLARQKMNAYQVDDNGQRWELNISERNSIRNATTEEEVEEVQKEIRQERFRDAVREITNGAAASDLGFQFNTPYPNGSDFIIDQYNKDGITPAEVVAAYNKGWIYGLEIRIDGGQKQYCFANGGWKDLDWTAHDRATYFDALSVDLQAQTKALQIDGDGERWDPPLYEKEIKEIEAAADAAAVATLLIKIKRRRLFFDGFWATPGASQNASPADILVYWDLDVGLTYGQAAGLYNGNPQIIGSELTKSSKNAVVYNGKDFDFTVLGIIDQLRAAKQAKIDADNAAAATARLANAKTTAETAIKTAQKETGKAEVTDTELNKRLKDTDKVLDDTCKSWQKYIQAPTMESEVSSRQAKVEAAITAIRTAKETPPFNPATARTAAIAAVKSHWKAKSSDQTEDGTVNGKKIGEVLGDKWDKEFNDKDKKVDIDNKEKELTDKIDAEKTQEPGEEELTDEAVEQALQTVFHDTTIKPQAEVVKSWQSYNNTDSKLKTAEQIKNFLEEEIKGKEEDFAKHLEELLEADRPTGNNDKEKVTNFVANQKAEIVVKAVFGYKLKDVSYQDETEAKMEAETDDEAQPLNEEVYPKENGKYTREAMTKYLFEKKTGQSHEFSMKDEDKNTPVSGKSHWEEWKYWYIGGGILILVVGLVVVFWDKLMGSTNQDE